MCAREGVRGGKGGNVEAGRGSERFGSFKCFESEIVEVGHDGRGIFNHFVGEVVDDGRCAIESVL